MKNKKLIRIVLAIVVIVATIIVSLFVFLRQPGDNNQLITTVQGKLVMGTEPGFKPFEYLHGDEVIGFDVDLAKEIASDANKQLVIEQMNFDGLLSALQARKVDMVIAGMTATKERAQNVSFSNTYFVTQQMILVGKDNNYIKNKDDLIGKKIGVQLGTTAEETVRKIYNTIPLQFTAVPAIVQEIKSGRIDAAVLDKASAEIYLQTNPGLKMLPDKLSEEKYAIAVRKEDHDLVSQINQTIDRIQTDGTYKKMIDAHFGEIKVEKMTFLNIFLGDERYMYLVKGLGVTLFLTVTSVVIGIVIGIVIALMRISKVKPFKRFKHSKSHWLRNLSTKNPLAGLAKMYTTVIRGTPTLVQLLIMYYVVFGSYQNVPKLLVAALAFGVNSGSYVAEIIRAAFENLPKGQWEASKSLGLSYAQTILYVTMPQALRAALPALINELITLLKETSIVGWIGATDLMRGADNIRFQTATAFEALIVAALIYLCLTTILTRIMTKIERKINRYA